MIKLSTGLKLKERFCNSIKFKLRELIKLLFTTFLSLIGKVNSFNISHVNITVTKRLSAIDKKAS